MSAGSELVAQHDGCPVPSWRAGELLLDSHPIVLDADLALGRHELVVGMYDLETLERVLPLIALGHDCPRIALCSPR